MKKILLLTFAMLCLWHCQSKYLYFKTRDKSKPTKVAGRGVQYFYKKEVDDLIQPELTHPNLT